MYVLCILKWVTWCFSTVQVICSRAVLNVLGIAWFPSQQRWWWFSEPCGTFDCLSPCSLYLEKHTSCWFLPVWLAPGAPSWQKAGGWAPRVSLTAGQFLSPTGQVASHAWAILLGLNFFFPSKWHWSQCFLKSLMALTVCNIILSSAAVVRSQWTKCWCCVYIRVLTQHPVVSSNCPEDRTVCSGWFQTNPLRGSKYAV